MYSKKQTLLACKKAHNFKYTYFWGSCTKNELHIKCPFHGRFKKSLDQHLFRKEGCPSCKAGLYPDWKDFVKLMKGIKKPHVKLIKPNAFRPTGYIHVECSRHGIKTQKVTALLNGADCPDCAKGIYSRKDYIAKANRIHKHLYSYDKIPDGNVHGDILVTCPVHGDFQTHSLAHLQGTGCRSCTYNDVKYFYIYLFVIKSKNSSFFKVGLAKDVEKREKQLRRGLAEGYTIRLLDSKKFKGEYSAFKCEGYFLDTMPGKPIKNKKIMKDGRTETKVNGLSIKKAKEVFDAIDRKYRRIYKTYVPRRQLWNVAKRAEEKKKRRFYFKR